MFWNPWYCFEMVRDNFLDIVNEMWEALRKKFSCRPENQRPRILFLDKRRKTYHCRNSCATDHW